MCIANIRFLYSVKISKNMPKQDRLFVPLYTEPFEDFRDYGKQYEIRSYGRNFTEKHVREGRPVELRKGYSLRENVPQAEWQLWGTLGNVIVGSLEDIFDQVDDYKVIEPRSDSVEKAIAENRDLLGNHPKYIAFQVLLNSME